MDSNHRMTESKSVALAPWLYPLKKNGEPAEIRTLDTRLRRPLLYPAELQAHVIIAEQYKKYGADDGNRTRIISLEG